MDDTLYCLVDPHGKLYVKHGAESFDDVAHAFGLSQSDCQEYRFDLAARRLSVNRATPAGAIAAQDYINDRLGSPERLMAFAREGHLPKQVLASLLSVENRQRYLKACAKIERKYTEACAAKNDPCLASGCSVEGEDETCLQPLLNAGVEYQQACAAEWIRLFRIPTNRIDSWRN